MAAPSIDQNSPITSFTHAEGTIEEIRALTFLTKWGEQGVGTGATVYYSFPQGTVLWSNKYQDIPVDEDYDPNKPEPDFIAAYEPQINAVRSALQAWSNVANIEFIEVETESYESVGDIRIYNLSFLDSAFAFGVPPIEGTPWAIASGDLGFNARVFEDDAESFFSDGKNGYQLALHELGHTLGLSHPFYVEHEHDHDYGIYQDDITLTTSKDHYQYTVMSYSDVAGRYFWDTGGLDITYFPTTPMLYDIQAIQYLYGANTSYNTGDNTYFFGIDYAYETIWDAGGNDTIENIGTLNSVINLNAGEFSSIGPSVKTHRGYADSAFQHNIAIAYDVTIENAIGGIGNDVIYGNTSSNWIDGGSGSDTFITHHQRDQVTSIIQRENGEILLFSATEQDTLTNIEKVDFADQALFVDQLLAQATLVPSYEMKQEDRFAETKQAQVYDGPVDALQFQFIGNNKGESIVAADTNDFINLLGGDDAANGAGGHDVLDGGIGSNFLTGGHGNDVFFIDGRRFETTWSTITDFQQGDEINIWGWIEGLSEILLIEEEGGADGYQGVTLHMDLNGNNSIDTSVTFTGVDTLSLGEWQNFVLSDGTGYLFISG